ncbi:MAG: preprotein translocase subunit SecY [Candidatus Woykebacteria bacterium RIFCSPHIGHO2_12_FULL_43_10]|uniref:Protein translocase subunit SecY n=2 Tax=Candidatus Woykeibacteriota TaxID=1817899 RepID=A0A1G1WXH7_9BACT|nr:MAG: preprotein translocase subunit SecY [Candidatus Woykebacteria bacterium RIFCSPHIGHO2_01_FULL_43_29]OGY28713.1 MAG: preprotein translocase subunit SecY [Candidatus Woykebacteria bacterium RIFCSPHIGHO2_02_FULL_43_16b]OGY29788.1 MAG: preprotein translocase subunit SecY [Candidatus Woykebacteria bacterium RIFCSPHIGHO2_12_FULL_43_10]OGY32462.1 MAG: preprotein translocase subunit SecY [Candidatus Woykebacteria bacterium RIFCSPLOWO2_01_FULL_43_14]
MLKYIRAFWNTPQLKKKLLITTAVLIIFRLVTFIPVPGADVDNLKQIISRYEVLGLLDLFSGGTFFNFSIIALGLNPYINASIIMQLFTMVFPKLEELSKEGEYGRRKINQYTRYLTVPLSLLQSFGIVTFLQRGDLAVFGQLSTLDLLAVILTLVAGAIFLMWLSELITENGIGNGASVIILVGIVSRLPVVLVQTFSLLDETKIFSLIGLLVIAFLVITGIVFVNEAHRRIPVQYARRAKDSTQTTQMTYLPLRVNQAGVIPIIFAISLVSLPSILGSLLTTSKSPWLLDLSSKLVTYFQTTNPVYYTTYFVLVLGFTYLYTAVSFNPTKIAEEIKKHGGFIPGIRPGRPTSEYLNFILNRITLPGAIFLGVIAVLPFVVTQLTNFQNLAIGGTGLLIVVSVILETSKQIRSMLIQRSYEGFLGK